MRKCDKCGAEIADGSKFCPQCADPVTEADVVARESMSLLVVCPKCEAQNHQSIEGTGHFQLTCPQCKRGFRSTVAQVRAKRSRGSKKDETRQFSVRVVFDTGRENLIEFSNSQYEDFELRAKDIAVFSYFGNKLRLVQNTNVRRYMKVSNPICFIAACVYGPNSEEARLLRAWRDNALLPYCSTRQLVRLYYLLSPKAVSLLGRNFVFLGLCRSVIGFLVKSLPRNGANRFVK